MTSVYSGDAFVVKASAALGMKSRQIASIYGNAVFGWAIAFA